MRSTSVFHTAFGAIAFAALMTAGAGTAFAYTPQWLQCTGDLTVTPTEGSATKQAATDVYVYDPDAKNLFKYLEPKKQLAYLGARPVSEQEMHWSGSTNGVDSSSWEGSLNRGNMSLRLTYKTDKETSAWAETCAPTKPRPEG